MNNSRNNTGKSKQIKVLFFVENLSQGGQQRQLVELLKHLSEYKNFDCTLVTMRKDIFFTEIEKLKVNIHFVERKYFKKDPVVFLKFNNIVKKIKPDIVHVWGNMTAIYCLLAKILRRFKLVNFQIQNAPLNSRFTFLNHKLTFPFSDKIIANSYAGLKSYHPPVKKSNVIYNGFDFDRLNKLDTKKKIREQLGIETQFVVGMTARYSNAKDYTSYIQAANIVLKKNDDITFFGIGSGNREIYNRLVDPLFVDKIKLLDQKENIESIINICNIGVLSTFTEGISNSIMEFMALKKPVIATNGGGTNELVVDGKTGYLIPQRSPKVMAEKIQYLFENYQTAQAMGLEGYHRIKKKFDISKMGDNFINLYQNLIEA